jgi:hypothetical protein
MTHSVKERRKRTKRERELTRRIEDIHRLAKKHYVPPEVVTLPHISLGNLRQQYHPHNPGWSGLSSAIKRMLPQFKRYPLNRDRPLEIYGSDGGLILVRDHIKDSHSMDSVVDSVRALPEPKKYHFKGINRGQYRSVHLGTWAAYSQKCIVTRELKDAGPKGMEFMERNKPLWSEMSRLLGQYAPGVFKQFQRYPLNEPCQRFCGAWCACVVNDGAQDPSATRAHRDVKEAQYGYSCIFSCGDFEGGALILYELGIVVEMGPGDMVMFPDCVVTHSNESAKGHRISIITFTQENVYDYWHRTYNLKLRRKDRIAKAKAKTKEKR